MDKSGWKVLAIIFIILFIIETCLIVYAVKWGQEAIEKETECSVNVCGSDIYDAYYYDDYEQLCYCYTNNEITKQQYLR